MQVHLLEGQPLGLTFTILLTASASDKGSVLVRGHCD
jgi:hypothetical protein